MDTGGGHRETGDGDGDGDSASASATPNKADCARLGCFWWDGVLCKKKESRLQCIYKYFDDACLRDMLLPIILKEGALSLRALDWLVTNYSKKVPVVYNVTPPNKPETLFNLHREYKDWLRNHKRKNFDPFRRGKRIFFDVDGKTYESTVGQLNFFFWASRYRVLEYARANIEKIEKDQAVATKHHNSARLAAAAAAVSAAKLTSSGKRARERNGTSPGPPPLKRKRRQLSQAPKEPVFVYPATVRVVFNPELGERTF
jgi:hypothetical protein